MCQYFRGIFCSIFLGVVVILITGVVVIFVYMRLVWITGVSDNFVELCRTLFSTMCPSI